MDKLFFYSISKLPKILSRQTFWAALTSHWLKMWPIVQAQGFLKNLPCFFTWCDLFSNSCKISFKTNSLIKGYDYQSVISVWHLEHLQWKRWLSMTLLWMTDSWYNMITKAHLSTFCSSELLLLVNCIFSLAVFRRKPEVFAIALASSSCVKTVPFCHFFFNSWTYILETQNECSLWKGDGSKFIFAICKNYVPFWTQNV